MSEGVGRNLTPSKLDKFGQVSTNVDDASGGDSPSAMESNNQHASSDLDSGPRSQHHTLGTGRNQSSPGNHIHDGVTSQKLGPMQINTSGSDLIPLLSITGSKAGNAALTSVIALLKNFINFTDNTT